MNKNLTPEMIAQEAARHEAGRGRFNDGDPVKILLTGQSGFVWRSLGHRASSEKPFYDVILAQMPVQVAQHLETKLGANSARVGGYLLTVRDDDLESA